MKQNTQYIYCYLFYLFNKKNSLNAFKKANLVIATAFDTVKIVSCNLEMEKKNNLFLNFSFFVYFKGKP